MEVLLDTDLITRLVNPATGPMQLLAEQAVESLRRSRNPPCLVPQNVYEFWAVATRPIAANGLGLSPTAAREEVESALQVFRLLQDERAIFSRWLDLVTTYDVKGKPSHDARLVAAMLRHGLTHVLPFNTLDFARYSEITAIAPDELVEGKVELTYQA